MKNRIQIQLKINSSQLSQMSHDLRESYVTSLQQLSPHEISRSLAGFAKVGNWDKWQQLLAYFAATVCGTYEALYSEGKLETDLELAFVQTNGKLAEFYSDLLRAINTIQKARNLHKAGDRDEAARILLYIPSMLDDISINLDKVKSAPTQVARKGITSEAFKAEVDQLQTTMYPNCGLLNFVLMAALEYLDSAYQFGDFAKAATLEILGEHA